jgi:hypothetical protein
MERKLHYLILHPAWVVSIGVIAQKSQDTEVNAATNYLPKSVLRIQSPISLKRVCGVRIVKVI